MQTLPLDSLFETTEEELDELAGEILIVCANRLAVENKFNILPSWLWFAGCCRVEQLLDKTIATLSKIKPADKTPRNLEEFWYNCTSFWLILNYLQHCVAATQAVDENCVVEILSEKFNKLKDLIHTRSLKLRFFRPESFKFLDDLNYKFANIPNKPWWLPLAAEACVLQPAQQMQFCRVFKQSKSLEEPVDAKVF